MSGARTLHGLVRQILSPLCSLFHRDCCWPSKMQHVAAVIADQHEGITAESLQVEGLEQCSYELVLLPPELLPTTNGALHARVAGLGLGCLGHLFPFCADYVYKVSV